MESGKNLFATLNPTLGYDTHVFVKDTLGSVDSEKIP